MISAKSSFLNPDSSQNNQDYETFLKELIEEFEIKVISCNQLFSIMCKLIKIETWKNHDLDSTTDEFIRLVLEKVDKIPHFFVDRVLKHAIECQRSEAVLKYVSHALTKTEEYDKELMISYLEYMFSSNPTHDLQTILIKTLNSVMHLYPSLNKVFFKSLFNNIEDCKDIILNCYTNQDLDSELEETLQNYLMERKHVQIILQWLHLWTINGMSLSNEILITFALMLNSQEEWYDLIYDIAYNHWCHSKSRIHPPSTYYEIWENLDKLCSHNLDLEKKLDLIKSTNELVVSLSPFPSILIWKLWDAVKTMREPTLIQKCLNTINELIDTLYKRELLKEKGRIQNESQPNEKISDWMKVYLEKIDFEWMFTNPQLHWFDDEINKLVEHAILVKFDFSANQLIQYAKFFTSKNCWKNLLKIKQYKDLLPKICESMIRIYLSKSPNILCLKLFKTSIE